MVSMEQHLKVVNALSELNGEFMALLEDRKDTTKQRKKGTFGKLMRQQFTKLTTPKFTSLTNSDVSDGSIESSPTRRSRKCTLSIAHLPLINISPSKHHSTSIQTDIATTTIPTSSAAAAAKCTESGRMQRELSTLKIVHHRMLKKLTEQTSTIDIHDGQIHDVAKERNELRKQLENIKRENQELLNVLQLKSKLALDPDLKPRQSTAVNVPSTPSPSPSPIPFAPSDLHEIYCKKRRKVNDVSTPQQIKQSGSFIFNRTYHNLQSVMSPPSMSGQHSDDMQPRRSKSVFAGLSPLKFSKIFQSAEKTKHVVAVAEDSKNLANRLMKVIQDKDDIIAGLQSEIHTLNTHNTL